MSAAERHTARFVRTVFQLDYCCKCDIIHVQFIEGNEDKDMQKALFFDIDGTLVDFQGHMPESAKEALGRAQQNGHKIVLCSGRSRMQMYPFLLEMGFDGIVAATGAYVECAENVIYRHFMSKEEISTITALLDEAGACYSAQAGEYMITSVKHKERQLARFRSLGDTEMIDQIWKRLRISENMNQEQGIEKFVYYESEMTVKQIQERLSGICDVTESSFESAVQDSGEITSLGINKSYGMQKYLECAGIARENAIAFGDGPNDFDMVEYAAVGVAMGNASASLKERADMVTASVNEHGVAEAMKKLGLI